MGKKRGAAGNRQRPFFCVHSPNQFPCEIA